MISALITALMLVSAFVVVVHCLRIAASINAHNWFGHRVEFFFVAASYTALFGGALGLILAWPPAPQLLLMGVAGRVLFDLRVD